jgi:hypothetical protein
LLVVGLVLDAANGAVAIAGMGAWMLAVAIAFLFSATVRNAHAAPPHPAVQA